MTSYATLAAAAVQDNEMENINIETDGISIDRETQTDSAGGSGIGSNKPFGEATAREYFISVGYTGALLEAVSADANNRASKVRNVKWERRFERYVKWFDNYLDSKNVPLHYKRMILGIAIAFTFLLVIVVEIELFLIAIKLFDGKTSKEIFGAVYFVFNFLCHFFLIFYLAEPIRVAPKTPNTEYETLINDKDAPSC